MKKLNSICLTALPLLLAAPGSALAQQAAPRVDEGSAEAPAEPRDVAFSADQLSYDSEAELVTATGDVRMTSEGNRLRAARVVWNRATDEVRAEGDVRVVNPGGDVAYADSVVLTDALRDGIVQNMLLVLADGGRLAADRAERRDGFTTLYRAAYSPCAVVSEKGCPKNPTWQINAVKVVHDPVRNRIRYEGASLNLLGARIVALPWLSHPDGTEGGGSGLLVPEARLSSSNGFELSAPYYLKLAPNRDATITPHVYTEVAPMLEGSYRQLTRLGAFQLGAYLTYGSRIPISTPAIAVRDEGIRAYLEGNGRFQLNPLWSVTASARYVTDRTFLRRYDISRDSRLRSVVEAERIDENSY
ncbi:MAG TPA: LPS-assembly protein LptD, partial [Allosphingosinicella sp.]